MANATYTVVKGDSLWKIAQKKLGKGSRWPEIAKLNSAKVKPPNYIIHPGDVLEMPGSSGSGTSANTAANTSNAPKIDLITLNAGSDRELFVAWSWSKNDTKEYRIVWSYYANGMWLVGNDSTKAYDKDTDAENRFSTYSAPEHATKAKVKIKPISNTKKTNNTETAIWTADWSNEKDATYDFSNNPPKVPAAPTVSVKGYQLTIELTGITDPNTTHVAFEIDKNDGKSITTVGPFAKNAYGEVSHTCNVDAGSKYRCRSRAYKDKDYSDWSAEYSDPVETIPATPRGFTVCRAIDKTAVHLEWPKSLTADGYIIEYAMKKEYFDVSDRVTAVTIEASETDSETITRDIYDLETGNEYFFRLRAVKNSEETSPSGLSSVRIGEKPAAPTTWSSTTTVIVGEELRLYWVHNTVDGSSQTQAILVLDIDGREGTHDITNDRPEDEKDDTSVYVIDTNSAGFKDGAKIKWKVRTKGVTDDWSDWSTERTIDIYAPPNLTMNIKNKDGVATKEVVSFPFSVYAIAGPETQTPIGYHISITSNDDYETVDELGNTKIMSRGSEVYSKHFDGAQVLDAKISAGDISLENNIEYTVVCTVTMDSGLTTKASSTFTVYWSDGVYVPNAEIGINEEALTAYIRPYLDIPGRNILLRNDSNRPECDPENGGYWICDGSYPEIGFKCKSLSKNLPAGTTVTAQVKLRGNANVRFFYIMEDNITGDPANTHVNIAGKVATSTLPTLNPDEYEYFSSTFTVPEGKTLTGLYVVTAYHDTVTNDWLQIAPKSVKLEIGSQATAWSAAPEDDGFTGTTLAVYRREFDGTFTEIATGIDDSKNTFVIDPHPSLDFARYRIVATSKTTGAVGYYDMPGYPVSEPAIVIQWDEEWTSFDAVGEDQMENRPWSGSLVKLPYNISVSDKTKPDISNIKYIGRKHPVAYYGTHVGQTSSWSTVIPKDDIETIYALRRLSMWMGDVYVREPSGIGYWANITVSLSQKHDDPTIPVSFAITRIEGGM